MPPIATSGRPNARAARNSSALAARACGLGDTGRLAAGLRADIVAVDGNPLERISDLEHVKVVSCNGRIAADPGT